MKKGAAADVLAYQFIVCKSSLWNRSFILWATKGL